MPDRLLVAGARGVVGQHRRVSIARLLERGQQPGVQLDLPVRTDAGLDGQPTMGQW